MREPESVGEHVGWVRAEIANCVVGMEAEIELLLCALLADRHVLVEGVPGIGKTHLINTLARTVQCSFKRIQFTPDLLPADILGGFVYNPKDGSLELRRGPIFGNVVLADEINRAPAKTQSALLEVMQERQVTIEGTTHVMDPPFFVFATQNPIEHEGVFPLPQAQLDRFAIRIMPEHPTPEEEKRILALHREPLPEAHPVLEKAQILAAQRVAEQITVSEEILTLIVELCGRTRDAEAVLLGASPRMALDLMHLARALALLSGRGFVIPDDIKRLFIPVGNHRIALSVQAQISGVSTEQVLHEALQSTNLV